MIVIDFNKSSIGWLGQSKGEFKLASILTYYDDINNLKNLIDSTDLANISNSMKKFNQKRKEKVYSLWEDIINAGYFHG